MLSSPRLGFTRGGHALIAADRDAVAVVDLQTGDTRRIACDLVIAAIGFADQVWIAHGRDPVIARHALDGAQLGDALSVPAGDSLVAAPLGAAAAVWRPYAGADDEAALAIVDDAGALTPIAGPIADVVAPLTGRRWATACGARITAPSGLVCELPAGARVVAAAVALDGAALVALAERPTGRELVVVGLANGRLQLRLPAPSPVIRLAIRRGFALAQVEPRRLAVIDLRAGRIAGFATTELDIEDFAVDPDGTRLAVRGNDARIDLVALRDAMAETPMVTVVDDADDGLEEITAERPVPAPSAIAIGTALPAIDSQDRIVRPLELRALAPLAAVAPIDQAAALALLDLEIRSVALWTLQAIAQAWDTRRIGYGNEGRHPYELEVGALLGMNRGHATDYVTAATEHLATHDAALAAHPDRRGAATPLGALATELGLSPLALDVLVVVLAPAMWSEAARLYGILANDPSRSIVDEALVEQILAGRAARHELAAELDARAPLVRLGLVRIEAGRARPFTGLAVDPIVLARLRRESPELGTLAVRGADRALEDLVLGTGVLEAALAGLARTPLPARLIIRGRPGSGRRTLFAALAAEAGRALGILDATLLPRGEVELLAALAESLRRAQLAGLVPCVVGLDQVAFGDRTARDAVRDVLRQHPGPLGVIAPPHEPAPFDPDHVAIELPVLAETERLAVWKHVLADAGLAVPDVDALAARYRIGPGLIHRAVAAARDAKNPAKLEAYIRQTRDARLGAYARRVERLASWDSLVLPPDVLDSLRELVARVRHRKTVFEQWGMEQTMATSRGLTALFSGPPGTGKTLVAGVIARELGLDLYQVDLSKVMSKWLGETEANLAAIFDAAEDGQVILLFDEADSLFAKRTEVRSSNDRYANLEVNYLLQRLDTFEGIAILTTNASGTIDPAFKRRLAFRLSFPFPDEETRTELWRAHLPPTLPVAGPLELDKLAHKYQLSGGYIRNACLRAAFLAAQDAGPLHQHHLERAVALEFAELGKLSSSGTID